MKDSLLVGLALGLLVGAVIGAKNKEVAGMIEKGKRTVKKQIDKI